MNEYTKERWVREGNKIKASGRGTIAVCPSPTNDCGVSDFIANAKLIVLSPRMVEFIEKIVKQDDWLNQEDFVEAKEILTKAEK